MSQDLRPNTCKLPKGSVEVHNIILRGAPLRLALGSSVVGNTKGDQTEVTHYAGLESEALQACNEAFDDLSGVRGEFAA